MGMNRKTVFIDKQTNDNIVHQNRFK